MQAYITGLKIMSVKMILFMMGFILAFILLMWYVFRRNTYNRMY